MRRRSVVFCVCFCVVNRLLRSAAGRRVQMAWFKLNDSLNTLKDQLSSVSSVVQEAFQEPPPDADDDAAVGDVFRRLETEKQRSDELSALCGSQLDEVRIGGKAGGNGKGGDDMIYDMIIHI